jgi:hypothetical protein
MEPISCLMVAIVLLSLGVIFLVISTAANLYLILHYHMF